MKSKLYLLLLCIGLQSSAFCQSTDLEKVKAPSSPAAAVIGIQPTAVLSPKSYEALETAVFSNFIGEQGQPLIPNNFGLEFAPYWTKDHPMPIQEYIYPGPLQSLWRNLSFSVASTQNYILKDTVKSNALGFGMRTTIYFNGKKVRESIDSTLNNLLSASELKDAVYGWGRRAAKHTPKPDNTSKFVDLMVGSSLADKTIRGYFFNDWALMNTYFTRLGLTLKKELPAWSEDKDKEKIFLDSLNSQLARFVQLTDKLKNVELNVTNRPGWKLDIAGALALDFPANDFNFSIAPQQSVWLTPSYRFSGKTSCIELLGVFRYNWYNLGFYKQYFENKETYEHNFDYGLSLNLLFKKLSLHVEALGRYSKTIIDQSTDASGITTTRSKTQTDFQCIGTVSYQISKKLMLSYNFGKQFEPILSYKGTLISVVNLNFGFGGPTAADVTNLP